MLTHDSRATIVRAGEVEFHSEAAMGFTIPPGGFIGWTDPIAARTRDVPVLSGPGSVHLRQQLGSRLLSLSGRCWAGSPQELDRYGELLAGLGHNGEPFHVAVQHAGRTMWATGYRAAGVRFEPLPALHRASYQFDIWFPDPRKYGVERVYVSTGSTVQAFHYGNTDAWPRFEITGFPSGYRIEGRGPNQGLFYTVDEKPSGAVDRIDFKTGQLLRDGTPARRVTPSMRVWPVKPFVETSWRVTALGSGSGSASMTVLDTWV